QAALDCAALSEGIEGAIALGEFARFIGTQEPLEVLAAAEARVRAGANRRSQARVIETLGDIAFDRSQHEEARRRFEEALPLFRQVGDVLGEANCIRSLG